MKPSQGWLDSSADNCQPERALGAALWRMREQLERLSAADRALLEPELANALTAFERLPEELGKTEKRLGLALEAGRMGTWEWDMRRGRVAWSPMLERIHGIPEGSFDETFEAYQSDIHPDDRQRVLCTIAGSVQSGENHYLEYRIVRPDGATRWLEASGRVLLDSSGAAIGMMGVCADVTERKLADLALRESEEWFATTLASIGDAVIATDSSGRVRYMNAIAEGLTSHRLAEVRGRQLRDVFRLLDERTRRPVEDRVERALRAADELDPAASIVLLRPDGTEIGIEDSAAPIRDANGAVVGVVVVFRDVTEKRREEARRAFIHEATRLLASTLDPERTIATVAQLAVPRIADWCAVDVLDEDGEIRRLAVAHVDPQKVELAHELHRRYPPQPDAPYGVPRVLRTGVPELVSEIPDELLVRSARDAEHLAIARELGLKSYMAVPICSADKVLGTVSFVTAEATRRLNEDDLRLAEQLCNCAAIAIENARLYRLAETAGENERASRVEAETLNRTSALLNATQLDLEKLVQTLTDEAVSLVSARFGAFFYTLVSEAGESFQLYTLSGAPKEAFSSFGLPRNTKIFAPTFAGEQVVRSDDIRKDPRYGQHAPHFGMPKGHLSVVSYLAVPVVSRTGTVIGGLFFGHPEPARFTDKHERLLAAVAAQAAVAIENAQLHQQTRAAEVAQAERAEQAAMAAEIGAAFTRGGSQREILASCCESVVRHLDAALARVWTLDATQSTLELRASSGVCAHSDDTYARVPLGEFKIGKIAQERTPHLTNDLVNDPWVRDPQWAKREGMVAFAGHPLVVENKLVGVFAMYARHALSEDTLRSLAAIADTLAVGIERKHSELLAEQEAQRTSQLQAVTSHLAAALTKSEVAEAIVSSARGVLGAAAAVIYYLEDGQFELAASTGLAQPVERLRRLQLDAPLPLAEALRTQTSLWYPTHASLLAAFPNLEHAATPRASLQAVAALPIVLRGKAIGGLALSFPDERDFDAAERAMFASLVQQGAQALSRASLYEAERQAREERESLVRELSETVRLNELFAGVLAHDLRNPLGAILTAAQLAMRRDESDHVVRPLRRILSSGERMTRMIEQLLDFTRLRVGGGFELDVKAVDLGEVCQSILSELEVASPAWTMHLVRNENTTGSWDNDRLMQVFSNLAGNAVQHGEPAGGLHIDIDGTERDRVITRVHNEGAIPVDLLPILFEPFRGTLHRRPTSQGLGLGLFIAKEIVAAHGGTIEVSSSAASGTTFTVVLPRVWRSTSEHGTEPTRSYLGIRAPLTDLREQPGDLEKSAGLEGSGS